MLPRYPYLVSDLIWSIAIGAGILAGLWLTVRQGW
jgi:hypothetical protein